MPPFRPPESLIETLQARKQKILDEERLRKTEIPAHKTISTRASELLLTHGRNKIFEMPLEGSAQGHGTDWYENPSLHDGARRTFYSLVSAGVSLRAIEKPALMVRVSEPHPTKAREFINEDQLLASFGVMCAHRFNNAVVPDLGVTNLPRRGQEPPTALPTNGESFRDVVDTLEFIAKAATAKLQGQAATAAAVAL